MLLLLKDEERGDPQLVAPKELNTLLGVTCCLHNDIVQSTDGSGDRNVVLLLDGTEVT